MYVIFATDARLDKILATFYKHALHAIALPVSHPVIYDSVFSEHFDELSHHFPKITSQGTSDKHLELLGDEKATKDGYFRKMVSDGFVLISSPLLIDHLDEHKLRIFGNCTFLTVGSVSASKLRSITRNEIIYPQNSSGKMALWEECLSKIKLNNKTIVELSIDKENQLDSEWHIYAKQNEEYETLSPSIKYSSSFDWNISNRGAHLHKIPAYALNLTTLNTNVIEYLLSSAITGLIVSSSSIANWLFDQVSKHNALDRLLHKNFIALHDQIVDALRLRGAINIKLVDNFDYNALAMSIHEGRE